MPDTSISSNTFHGGSHAPGDRWVAADILHEILIEAIKRHKGRMSFADDVVTMLAATQAYEVVLERQSSLGVYR